MWCLAVAPAGAGVVELEWDASPDAPVAGYNVHYGTSSGNWTGLLDVGNVTTARVLHLDSGVNYYFSVTAYNLAGLESLPSNEISAKAANQAPSISALGNQSLGENSSTGLLTFTVGDSETPAANLTVSGTSSNTTLVPATGIVFGGSGASRTVSIKPAADQGGTATITVKVSDGALTSATTFSLTVKAANALVGVNAPPTLSALPARSVNEDADTGVIPFTVGDTETPASNLTVTGSSSNTALVPVANIVFGGSGANRTVLIKPAANQSGTSNITVTVSDGALTSATTFLLTVNPVNDPPALTSLAARSINEDTDTGAIAFTVSDVETPAANLTVTGSSSNTVLVPAANIVFGGSGASRTVSVKPAANQSGTANITVAVSDGALTSSTSFALTVNPVNDPPSLTTLPALSINEDADTGAIPFTVGDAETPAGSLTVSASSSNTDLVPNSAIVLGGSAAARTLLIRPVADLSGTTSITVTVSDGVLTSASTLLLTVNAVNDLPAIMALPPRTINEDGDTGAIPFIIGDVETPAASLTLSGSSSNTTLVPGTGIIFGGSGATRTVSVKPAANLSGTANITVTVSDGTGTSATTFLLTVNAVNDAPTITALAARTINEDADTGLIALTVRDVDTPLANLILGGTSSNTALVPHANVIFGGSAGSRTVLVKPVANQSGVANITITVSDGALATATTFRVTVVAVNDPPALTAIPPQAIGEDARTGALAFTVGDVDTAAENLTVSGVSSNTALVPNAGILFGGSGASRTVSITPAANQSGIADITVTVSDGALTSSATFRLTVTPVNDPPVLTAIQNQSIQENSSTAALAFTVGDLETAPGSLLVGADSSNVLLVPPANIVFGGSGASRTLTITPAANLSGTAVITVLVTDGSLVSAAGFVLTVVPLPAGTAAFASSTPITIPALGNASPYQSDINVSGLGGAVSGLTVTLKEISHTCPDDLDILLVGPTGVRVLLLSDAGGSSAVNAVTLMFADNATARPPDNTLLSPGKYLPGNYDTNSDLFPAPAPPAPWGASLTAFNGLPANGVWSLYVRDDKDGNWGSIAGGWSLTFTTVGKQPPAITDIPDQRIAPDTLSPAIPFAISDPDTSLTYLTVSAVSSNTDLVTSENVVISGSGASRTVTLIPESGQSGATTITITVSDGRMTVSDSFTLTVESGDPASSSASSSVGSGTTSPAVDPVPLQVWFGPGGGSGSVVLLVAGTPLTEFTVEASEDMIVWEEIGSLSTGETGAGSFADGAATGFRKRFYRLFRRQSE